MPDDQMELASAADRLDTDPDVLAARPDLPDIPYMPGGVVLNPLTQVDTATLEAELARRAGADPVDDASPEEAEHVAEMDHWRGELEKGLTRTLAELRAADAAYQYLVDGLYDVEFAEGHGTDIAHHLDVAAKALRAADALRHRSVTPTRTS